MVDQNSARFVKERLQFTGAVALAVLAEFGILPLSAWPAWYRATSVSPPAGGFLRSEQRRLSLHEPANRRHQRRAARLSTPGITIHSSAIHAGATIVPSMATLANSISLPLLGEQAGHESHGSCGGSSPVEEPIVGAGAGSAVPRSVYLETFGCQMNELDSELVRGRLASLGYRFTESLGSADVVLYNTCSVRQQAENKVLSRLGIDALRRREGHRFVLGVIGCLAEREGTAMLRKYPHIDVLCGPGELDRLPMLLENALRTGLENDAPRAPAAERAALAGGRMRRAQTLAAVDDDLELLDLGRVFVASKANANGRSAYVRITRGCNKFCTYCVVPNTRGPEVHRPPQAIIDECKRLAEQGVIEVTLLGQTVNHYVYVHGTALDAAGEETAQLGPGLSAFRQPDGAWRGGGGREITTFARLLQRIHDEVPAIRRLRFVTSYPRDFGDDILRVMAACPRICRYLHVPAQSGSNRILKLMNRGYTVEEYLEFIHRARAIVPDVEIAGDIIVGFPGETDEDFQATCTLVEQVRCKNNFIFKYSPRPGTAAIDRFKDDVPDDVKRRRNNRLLAIQERISAAAHARWVGRTVDVFVEEVQQGERGRMAAGSRAASDNVPVGGAGDGGGGVQVVGRTGGDLIVVGRVGASRQAGEVPEVGQLVQVRVDASGPLLLRGEVLGVEP